MRRAAWILLALACLATASGARAQGRGPRGAGGRTAPPDTALLVDFDRGLPEPDRVERSLVDLLKKKERTDAIELHRAPSRQDGYEDFVARLYADSKKRPSRLWAIAFKLTEGESWQVTLALWSVKDKKFIGEPDEAQDTLDRLMYGDGSVVAGMIDTMLSGKAAEGGPVRVTLSAADFMSVRLDDGTSLTAKTFSLTRTRHVLRVLTRNHVPAELVLDLSTYGSRGPLLIRLQEVTTKFVAQLKPAPTCPDVAAPVEQVRWSVNGGELGGREATVTARMLGVNAKGWGGASIVYVVRAVPEGVAGETVHAPDEHRFTVSPGSVPSSITVPLELMEARYTVKTEPPVDFGLAVDGIVAPLPMAPGVYEGRLPAGCHRFEITRKGGYRMRSGPIGDQFLNGGKNKICTSKVERPSPVLKAVGIPLLVAGVAGIAAGGFFLAEHGKPACGGTDCYYQHNTLGTGLLYGVSGTLALAAGAAMVGIDAKRHDAKDSDKSRVPPECVDAPATAGTIAVPRGER